MEKENTRYWRQALQAGLALSSCHERLFCCPPPHLALALELLLGQGKTQRSPEP